MSHKIYQLKVTLMHSNPPIWRTILVYADTNLNDLHRILQTTMGWTNSHLHEFNDGKHGYSPAEFQVEDNILSDKVKLSKLVKKENDRLTYLYDFGDSWSHMIVLEKILDSTQKEHIPSCLDGKRRCPPEDCGGMHGYEELQQIIKDPNHEERAEMIVWLGGIFDPEYFNKIRINRLLKSKDFGCIWL